MSISDVEILPLTGRIGAEIRGIDLSDALDEKQVALIRDELLSSKVVFFRDQRLDPDAQLAFARHFGAVTRAHPTVPSLREKPHVLDVDARGGNVAIHWHTDVTFVDRPPMASVLRAVVVPSVGGDTLWSNTVAAYEDLPEPLRTLADDLNAVHTNRFDYAGGGGARREGLAAYAEVFQSVRYETVHPVVRVHPETGERALFVGGFARRIVGVSEADSRAILRLLQARVERPENVVRWRWRPGDVAFWDNRATQHRAIADFDDLPRRLHRVTIAGDVPRGVDGRQSRALAGDSAAYLTEAA
jgi:taurine dioxygenase